MNDYFSRNFYKKRFMATNEFILCSQIYYVFVYTCVLIGFNLKSQCAVLYPFLFFSEKRRQTVKISLDATQLIPLLGTIPVVLQGRYLNIFASPFLVFFVLVLLIFLIPSIDMKIYTFASLRSLLPFGSLVLFFWLMVSKTLFHLLFLVEVLSYLTYFQFFTIKKKKLQQFVDLFLLFYWSSFLGALCLFWGAFSLLFAYNTLDFGELQMLFSCKPLAFFTSVIFLLGILLKLGGVGVHFLKLELYKYLAIEATLNFSIVASFIFIFIFIKLQLCGVLVLTGPLGLLLPALLLGGILIFVSSLGAIYNIVIFFGYSGLLTTCLLLLLLL